MISPEAITDNLTSTISDHLRQFMIVSNVFCNPPSNKANIFEGETFRSLLVTHYFLLVARCSLLFPCCSTRNSEGFFLVKVNKRFSILICAKSLICE